MMRLFKQIVQCVFLFSVLLLGIIACHQSPPPPPSLAELRLHAVQQLNEMYVHVVRIGDEMSIIIPAPELFIGNTERWTPSASQTMDAIIQLVNLYPSVAVSLGAYTDANMSPARSLALSTAWAQNVAHYLWQHGLDTRLLVPKGYGACDPHAQRVAQKWLAIPRVELRFRVIETIETSE